MKHLLKQIKSEMARILINARGWRTNRKIVVIESDDWGSIRMPNKAVQEKFRGLGYDIGDNPYCRYDTLANSEDLEVLFDSLSKFKDKHGNTPIFTFNAVMANPKFEEIKANNFYKYTYEPFTETLKNYYPNENVFELWQQGIDAKIIQPQFHGREHVNIPLWLAELRNKNTPLLDAFYLDFWGIPKSLYDPKRLNIQATYDSSDKENIHFYKESIEEGLTLFSDIFGFKSKTFIANNYTWSSELDETLSNNRIVGIQSMRYQKLPLIDSRKKRLKKEIYTGKKNKYGQIYTVRNCVFEPSQFRKDYDNVGSCLKQIEQAFFFMKPAILTSHRINYISSLDEENRNTNIKSLKVLLGFIFKKWPEVEFMSSDELTELI